jgi:chromosome segregation ATPase
VTRRQGQLDSLEALYAERQDSLRQTAHELAWQRGELSTLESSLSESLRRKADAEYQSLEDSLRRCVYGRWRVYACMCVLKSLAES